LKILFIYPNIGVQIGFNYGLAALSAACKTRGHATALINMSDKLYPDLDEDGVVRRAIGERPGAVGFSIVSQQWGLAKRLAGRIREELGVPVIAGGVHVTMVPKDVMDSGAFDFAAVGEADLALPDLLDAIEAGKDTTSIPNIWAQKNGKVVSNPVARFPDINELPPLDYDLFDFQRMTGAKGGWVGVLAGRGCPYRCTYCFNHAIIERYRRDTGLPTAKLGYVRFIPVGRVVDNLCGLAEKYEHVTTFIFDDDVFTFDRSYVLAFCGEYEKRGPGVPFVINAHIRMFDREVADALAHAGCKVLKFGLESGNARVRSKILRRPMSNKKIEYAFCAAKKAGLHTSAFLMLGLPTETTEELRDTVRMLGRIRPGRFRWSVFYPFPGTEAHRIAIEAGQLDEKKMGSIRSFMQSSCLDFGAEQNLLIEKMNAAFPWFVNAETALDVAPFYKEQVEKIENMNAEEFEEFKKEFSKLDEQYSKRFVAEGLEHYAVKYNSFTGVSNTYFLNEDEPMTRKYNA
jgi:radical SAM superfamily enzyme YgiQ (UPF0313 family)